MVCREFIGRTIETEFLLDRAARAQSGRGSTLIVEGSAGIGKSRLVREFAQAQIDQGMSVATSACWEYGDAPYAPLIDIAELLGVHAAVTELQAAADETGSTMRERQRRFALYAAALAKISMAATVIAIVEDIHWADVATLELFNYLAGALREHRVVLVATTRGEPPESEPQARRLRAQISRSADATIALDSLNAGQMRSLLASVLRDDGRRVPAVLLEEITELADGHPFHAEELMRGLLDRRGGNVPAAAAVVPPTLRASVNDRLAQLSEDERTVLAYAAVIGRRFSAMLLAELASEPLANVLLTLRRARNLQLIIEDPDGEHFLFRHALTREVVYAEILFAEARALHQRIVAKLEADVEPDASALAYHAWRSGDRALSYRWNEIAGDAAALVFAHVDAVRHFERAFDSCDEPRNRAILAEKTAHALHTIGDVEDAAEWFDRSAREFRLAGDIDRSRAISLDRARAVYQAGRYNEALALAEAITLDLAGEDTPLRYQAETFTAGLYNNLARSKETLAHLEVAAGLTCTPEPLWAARFLNIRAYALFVLHRYDESHRDFAAGREAARVIGDREQEARSLNNWANAYRGIGDLAGARRCYHEALEIANDIQSTRLTTWVGQNLAFVELLMGNFAACREAIEDALSIDHDVAIIRLWLHAILMRLGTLTADPALQERADITNSLAQAYAIGEPTAIVALTGALLEAKSLTGEDGTPEARRALEATSTSMDPTWLAHAITRCAPTLAPDVRTRLAHTASESNTAIARAHLQLFDARIALRERRKDLAEQLAGESATTFQQLGWAVDEAYAREVQGNVKEAVALFRTLGAIAEATRLTTTDQKAPRKRGETTLTAREREIAALAAAGQSNRQIAERLVISERTVETHVASIFQKLGVANRRELASLIAPAG